MNKRTLQLLCAIFILGIAMAFLTKEHWQRPMMEWLSNGTKHVTEISPPLLTPPNSDAGKTFTIKRIQVLKGDQFDIVLDDDNRILARLKVIAAEGAKPKVVDLLNHCDNPRVCLLEKQADGQWLVEIKFKQANKDVDLATWLSNNNLIYKNE